MIVNLSKKTAPMALLAMTLAACGGGGTSNAGATAPPVVASFPVQQALGYAYTHGLQSSLAITGSTSNGSVTYPVTGSLSYTLGIAVNATFNGAAALQSMETLNGTLIVNGASHPLTISGPLYVNAQYAPVGSSESGDYCVASSSAGYPATATAGQSGDIASFNCYTDSSRRTLVSTQKITYVTTAGSDGSSLNFLMLSNVADAAGKPAATTTTTYAISAAGIPKLIRVQMTGTESGINIDIDAK